MYSVGALAVAEPSGLSTINITGASFSVLATIPVVYVRFSKKRKSDSFLPILVNHENPFHQQATTTQDLQLLGRQIPLYSPLC